MNYTAMIKLIVSMAIFGSIGLFTKNAGIPAVELVFVRCIFATIFLSTIWYFTGGHKKEAWNKKEVLQTIFCGIFLVLNWVFLFKAFEEMSISVAISIYNLAPIFVMILGAIFLQERYRFSAILAVIICFIGSFFIVGMDNVKSFDQFIDSGVIWAFLSAFCYGSTMFVSKNLKSLSPYATTFIQTIVGVFMLFLLCDFSVFQGLSSLNWFFILGTGIIHTGFVYYLFFDSIRHLPTIVTSVLVFVDPVVAILLDFVILDFRPTLYQTIGICLVFGGILYTVFKPAKKQRIKV